LLFKDGDEEVLFSEDLWPAPPCFTLSKQSHKKSRFTSLQGNPAFFVRRSAAFRPCLTTGLALSGVRTN
jgi:hypothetical protein